MVERTPSYEELEAIVAQLREENRRLSERVETLEAELAEARQAAARQAAPFRRREALKKPDAEKKRPGRTAGHEGHYRQRPAQIDEAIEAPLPGCPHCQGELSDVRPCVQVIEELPPVSPRRIKLTTWCGHCARCGEVRSTHPLQTSTAVGAAGTHLGPRAQALAVALNHQLGLTMSRTCEALRVLSGLRLTPGGLSQLLARVGRRVASWHAEIRRQIRASDALYGDETSWYVAQPGWWLWVFTTPAATLYRVERGRGADVVRDTLGEDFHGVLVSDCLSSYNPIDCRKHKCIAHHLRALKEHAAVLERRGIFSRYLLCWKIHLQDVIETWKQRATYSATAYAEKLAQLERGVDNLLHEAPAEPEEEAFGNRLRRQRAHLLGCLHDPAAEPTNNRAERDLRPAVISRKISCGNRTLAGKITWETLRSIVVTAQKQGRDLLEELPRRLTLALPPP